MTTPSREAMKSHWNYRIVETEPGWFAICEVHYDEQGRPYGYSNAATVEWGEEDGAGYPVETLRLMNLAFNHPTLKPSDMTGSAT